MKIEELYQVICDRRDHQEAGSYTAMLLAQGENEILKKIGEESIEILIAAKDQGDERLIEEISDLIYHVLVLMAQRNLKPDHIWDELEKRHSAKTG
jgi:phosphoribosyl-ATP pyrophosphohydrolase